MVEKAAEVLRWAAGQGGSSPTKIILCGHSMGGAIAARLAAQHPELVRAVILEDPALLTDQQAEQYRAGAADLVSRQQRIAADPGTAIRQLQDSHPGWPAEEYQAWAEAKSQVDLDFLNTGIVGSPTAPSYTNSPSPPCY
ncbi:hypothetical protein BM477_00125 [Boudabousia marimammalium]|uniref:AB hydrolase-1 domain-containing protein n=2 Tax=Boudabousia marimammalium TaxID=156892 RepID=A0A1Q5PSB3_9ACTO|nr:hypothetical protein BM477_00125 [Boudabousia marimammalium]